jgi:hypothetical protein
MLCVIPALILGLQGDSRDRVVWDSEKSTMTFSMPRRVSAGFRLQKRDKKSGAVITREYQSSELGFERLVGNPDEGPFAVVRVGIGGWDHCGNSHILQPNLETIMTCRDVWHVGPWGALISDVKDGYWTNLRFIDFGKKPKTRWTRPFQGVPTRLDARKISIKRKGIVIDARTGKTIR